MFADTNYDILELDYIGDMIAVSISAVNKIFGLVVKALKKYYLGWVASILNLIIKIPEYIYYSLAKSRLNPQKIGYLKSYPLGFSFMLEKQNSDTDTIR